MFLGFEISINRNDPLPWKWTHPDRELAQSLEMALEREENKKEVTKRLSSISMDGTKTMQEWFPQGRRHVFISHSHADSDVALNLAAWMREEFSLSTFIDSCIWGDSAKLLREVDDKFCYNADSRTYRYNDRNKSTSHIHSMLTASLIQMMDKCEIIIFLNSPKSVLSTQDSMKATTSPWIMAELSASRFLRRNQRTKIALEGINEMKVTGSNFFRYELDTEHLITLSSSILSEWARNKKSSPHASMDELYKIISRGA